ncbi:MAG: serine--tRNA ligase [Dehalococcoidia bacterium]|nr:serine--tRNA ligase [Dehalococcoidia bacterium]
MLDPALLRRSPDLVRQALAERGDPTALDPILALDERHRNLLAAIDQARAERNALSKLLGQAHGLLAKEGPDEPLPEKLHPLLALVGGSAARVGPTLASVIEAGGSVVRERGEQMRVQEQEERQLAQELHRHLLRLPNLPHSSVPRGADASANVVVREWGRKPQFEFAPRPHWELGEGLGIFDFERGAKLAGARFYALKGAGARLERALGDFMVDIHVREHGYTELWIPHLVRREMMEGTGQLPKFEEDAYRIESDDLFLVPTAEVPLTNFHGDEILDAAQLPLKYVALSPCFRREAGAAGRDTKGILRVHQFDKVELVKLATPATSYDELESLVHDAEAVLQRLGLHYRVLLLCTGDLGFAPAKTYDLEAWSPAQQRYIEVSSCSNCEAFQARRANIKFRPAPGAKAEHVHTLNGSGLAVGRTMALLLEHYQQADGSVNIPEALQPYTATGGAPLTAIGPGARA